MSAASPAPSRGSLRLRRRRPTAGEALSIIETLAEAAGHPRPLAVDVFDRTVEGLILQLDRSERRRLRYALGDRMELGPEWPWIWRWLGGRPDAGAQQSAPLTADDEAEWEPVGA